MEHCRCYADVTFGDPKKNQVCGTKRRGFIVPCDPGACHGGCSGAEPYGFGKMYRVRVFVWTIACLFAAALALTYLKMLAPEKV